MRVFPIIVSVLLSQLGHADLQHDPSPHCKYNCNGTEVYECEHDCYARNALQPNCKHDCHGGDLGKCEYGCYGEVIQPNCKHNCHGISVPKCEHDCYGRHTVQTECKHNCHGDFLYACERDCYGLSPLASWAYAVSLCTGIGILWYVLPPKRYFEHLTAGGIPTEIVRESDF